MADEAKGVTVPICHVCIIHACAIISMDGEDLLQSLVDNGGCGIPRDEG